MNNLKCLRCGHDWVQRVENPKHCPKCISPYWNTPRRGAKLWVGKDAKNMTIQDLKDEKIRSEH